MRDGGIGRILVAALHQGIADHLPSRLEFYENWLHPIGLRDGTIGLAPLAAVLSFLRREDGAYGPVTRRAGEYAAQWTIDGLSPVRRRAIGALPRPLRVRLALRVARDLVGATYGGSRAVVRVRSGRARVDIRSSIFCGVREPAAGPLCGFYAAAFERALTMLGTPATARMTECLGAGGQGCRLEIAFGGQPLDEPTSAGELAVPAGGLPPASEGS
jgi:hypothetical protein